MEKRADAADRADTAADRHSAAAMAKRTEIPPEFMAEKMMYTGGFTITSPQDTRAKIRDPSFSTVVKISWLMSNIFEKDVYTQVRNDRRG